jgi:Ser/Thr protein kinase RdoA (MazF antagonist)
VLRGRGFIAKIGPGVRGESFVLNELAPRIPLALPAVMASGPDWIIMRDVPDIGGRWWDEDQLMVLTTDLAQLHDALLEDTSVRSGPLSRSLRDYFGRAAHHGDVDGVLPRAIVDALAEPGPLIALLDRQQHALVHGDPYPSNIRCPQLGQRVWIDWEDAVFGPPAIDLAVWLGEGHWSLDTPLDRDRCLATYRSARARPVDRAELEQSLDAAIVLITPLQNAAALQRERGALALRRFVSERMEALERLGYA